MTHRANIRITGELHEGFAAQEVADQIHGAEEYMIPGVNFWSDMVGVTGEDGVTVISGVIEAEDRVPADDPNGYSGDRVSSVFIITYIMGAGDFWVTYDNQSMLTPSGVALTPAP